MLPAMLDPPSSASLLPQELIDHIIDDLREDAMSLRSRTLTHSSFLLRSQQHLFRDYTLIREEGFQRFQSSLGQHPYLAIQNTKGITMGIIHCMDPPGTSHRCPKRARSDHIKHLLPDDSSQCEEICSCLGTLFPCAPYHAFALQLRKPHTYSPD